MDSSRYFLGEAKADQNVVHCRYCYCGVVRVVMVFSARVFGSAFLLESLLQDLENQLLLHSMHSRRIF